MTKIKTAALPEIPGKLIAAGASIGAPIGRYRSLARSLAALGVELPSAYVAGICEAVEAGQRMLAPLGNVVDEIEAAAYAGRDWTTDGRVLGAAIASSYSEGIRQRATDNLNGAIGQMFAEYGEDIVARASAAVDTEAIARAAAVLPVKVTALRASARVDVPFDVDVLAVFVDAVRAEEQLGHAAGVFASVNGEGIGRGQIGVLGLADVPPAELAELDLPTSGTASLALALARNGYDVTLTTPAEWRRRIGAWREYLALVDEAESKAHGKGPGESKRILAEWLKPRL